MFPSFLPSFLFSFSFLLLFCSFCSSFFFLLPFNFLSIFDLTAFTFVIKEDFDYSTVPANSRTFFETLNAEITKAEDFFLDQRYEAEKRFGELAESLTRMEKMV